MSLFNKVRAGEVTLEAFKRQLADYEAKRIELMRDIAIQPNNEAYFKNKIRELDLSISFTQIFIDKFSEIRGVS